MRSLLRCAGLGALLALALVAPACEEGERIDLGGGGDTGVVVEVRLQSGSSQPTKGQPLNLEAVVSEDGAPLVATQVTWSVSPDDGTLTFNANTSSTNTQGVATATLNTTPSSPSSITVSAAASGATGSEDFILQ